MERRKILANIIHVLRDEVVEYKENENSDIAILLKDVNLEIKGVIWHKVLEEKMEQNGYQIEVTNWKENWVTISTKELKNQKVVNHRKNIMKAYFQEKQRLQSLKSYKAYDQDDWETNQEMIMKSETRLKLLEDLQGPLQEYYDLY